MHLENIYLNITLNKGLNSLIYWEKRKDLRKQSLHRKIAASFLLKLFISGNERCKNRL